MSLKLFKKQTKEHPQRKKYTQKYPNAVACKYLAYVNDLVRISLLNMHHLCKFITWVFNSP